MIIQRSQDCSGAPLRLTPDLSDHKAHSVPLPPKKCKEGVSRISSRNQRLGQGEALFSVSRKGAGKFKARCQ